MEWTPYLIFIVAGVVSAAAQKVYFDRLSAVGQVSTDSAFADRVVEKPARVLIETGSESERRWKALLRRQPDPWLEASRLIACLAVAASFAAFAWIFLGIVIR